MDKRPGRDLGRVDVARARPREDTPVVAVRVNRIPPFVRAAILFNPRFPEEPSVPPDYSSALGAKDLGGGCSEPLLGRFEVFLHRSFLLQNSSPEEF